MKQIVINTPRPRPHSKKIKINPFGGGSPGCFSLRIFLKKNSCSFFLFGGRGGGLGTTWYSDVQNYYMLRQHSLYVTCVTWCHRGERGTTNPYSSSPPPLARLPAPLLLCYLKNPDFGMLESLQDAWTRPKFPRVVENFDSNWLSGLPGGGMSQSLDE